MKYRDPSVGEWLLERKRLLLYVLSFVAVVAVQTTLYWWGMAALEDDPRSVLESLEFVVQSLTTTGYGQDAPWESTALLVLAITAQFTGVAYLFIAFPLFVAPWARDAIGDSRVPEAIDDVADHVIVCGYSSLCSTLADDLEARGQPHVILESDEDLAQQLHDEDRAVVHGSLGPSDTLSGASVREADAFVVGATRGNAIDTVLSIREFGPDLEIVCLVEDPERARYLRFAGATTVLSPKHRLGKSVADKVQSAVSTGVEADEGIEIAEFPVREGSPVYGRRFDRLDALEATGATVVGAWIRGEFVTSPDGDEYVDANTVLVVAGTEDQFDRVERRTNAGGRFPEAGPVILAGHGIVGTTAAGVLRTADRRVTIVDSEAGENVDVVGDATTVETLHEAGIDDAGTVILAVSDDDAAIMATLVAREANPDVEIVVAATDAETASTLYGAGADFVLALPNVAGRMTALELFDEDVMTLRERIRLARTAATGLEGEHPRADDLRRPNAEIVAVERAGEVIADFDEGFTIAEGDDVIVAGTDEGVGAFESEFADAD